MKLFFDENIGDSVPRALQRVGVREIDYLIRRFRRGSSAAQGVQDEDWLAEISDQWLVVSRDQALFASDGQLPSLINHRVGLICITSGSATRFQLLEFILCRWALLQQIDAETPRPFVFQAPIYGQLNQVALPTQI